jgi:hypothetical protein
VRPPNPVPNRIFATGVTDRSYRIPTNRLPQFLRCPPTIWASPRWRTALSPIWRNLNAQAHLQGAPEEADRRAGRRRCRLLLGVSAGSLGAGNAAVTSCTSSISTSYTVAYDSALPGYKVNNVTVSGTLTSCASKNLTVDLVNGSNVSIGQISHTITSGEATGGSISLAAPAGVNAAQLANVHAVISG